MQTSKARLIQGPHVLANCASGIVEIITRMGGDPDRVFGVSRVAPEILDDPMAPLALKAYCDLFENAARETRNDNFGLYFGAQFEPDKLGAVGYLAISSPTLGAALSLMCQWFPIHQQDTILRLRHTPQASFLEYQIRNGNVLHRRQDAELTMCIFANVFKQCLGPRWTPLKMEFEHPRPASIREHQGVFGCTPLFGAACNSIMFRRSELATPMPRADPLLLATLLPLVRNHAAAREVAPKDFLGLVKQLIREQSLSGSVCLEAVAQAADMSVSGLYRRLKDHGTTFNDLVKGTRHALAIECVGQPHIPLTEVALMLGYSELSAFSRAFKAWSGLSPMAYRKKVQHGQS